MENKMTLLLFKHLFQITRLLIEITYKSNKYDQILNSTVFNSLEGIKYDQTMTK